MAWRPVQGGAAEDRAAHWCRERGWRLLERNFRARGGEIDLICLDGETLVFIEVRQRRSVRYGGAAASVTPGKQRKVVRAAQHYLQSHPPMARRPARFDVLALGREADIDWIKSAFTT